MIKSRAIVLHRFPYSDSSFIVKALTEECGIVSFIVKGGKKKESPFRGALDPLSLSEVVFRQNPNTELQFIKEATLLDWRKNLRNDLLCLSKAQVMTEMILRYAPQGVPLQEEFARLEQAISEFEEPAAVPTRQMQTPPMRQVPRARQHRQNRFRQILQQHQARQKRNKTPRHRRPFRHHHTPPTNQISSRSGS